MILNKIKYLFSILFVCASFSTAHATFHINEVMPANASLNMDSTYNYSGWVEIYNDAFVAQSLYGYYLSCDASNLKQFRITDIYATVPARGFYLIFFDHHDMNPYQIDYKLDCDGGSVFLSTRTGALIDEVYYPEQIINTSYARLTNGGDDWGICTAPTPDASNNNATFATNRCEAPVFSRDGGVFLQSITVDITSPEGKKVYYTTDGTEPNAQSKVWSGSQTITSNTIIRAQVIEEGFIPSPLITRTFIISDHEITLPVVCLCTAPKNLTDNTIGIYVRGTNGITGNGQSTPCNWNQDWSRPASFEYYVNGELVVDQQCDIAIGGGWTRGYSNVKSLKLNAEKKFEGKNTFDYDFFVQKPGLKFKSIYLRSSGNDYNISMMNDAFQQCLVGEVLDIEYQAYQPVVHFINGVYYGIINMRERTNTQYVYSNFGYEKTELDMVEKIAPSQSPYFELKTGSLDAINEVLALADNAVDESVYQEICERVDIDEFIAYLVPEIFSGNWDFPENNVKFFRHVDNGKFRWILYDLENGWSSSANVFNDGAHGLLGTNNTGSMAQYSHTAVLFQKLIKNESFKNRLIDYFSLCMGTLYQQERIANTVDSIAALIRPEIPYEQQNIGYCWGFENAVSGFKTTMNGRPYTVMNQIKNLFGLQGTIVSLKVSSNVPKAAVKVNNIQLPLETMDGYTFTGRTLNFTAEAPHGYKFKQWSLLDYSSSTVFPSGSKWSYYDSGSLDNANWTASSYNSSSWATGNAPLGYGKNGLATTVSYGQNANSKNPTTYFRTSFSLSSLSSSDEFTAELSIDDGAAVYVNGNEVYRYLLNNYASYDTYASNYADDNPDRVSFSIPASYFKNGTNVIAVEVHQYSASSSDIYLDMSISKKGNTQSSGYSIPELALSITDAVNIQAVFEEMENREDVAIPVRINELSASNGVYINEYFKRNDWIELYNTTGEEVSIAGLYISNNLEEPQLYQLPDSPEDQVVIPPYGYRILWADKLEDNTQLHLPFKLPAEGGKILLSAYADNGTDLLWCDSMTYVPHTSTNTFGRYPDGTDSIYIFNRTSFAKKNIHSPYNNSATALIAAFNDSIANIKTDPTLLQKVSEEVVVVSTVYYNLNGIALGNAEPAPQGVYIKCDVFSNGLRTYTKIKK